MICTNIFSIYKIPLVLISRYYIPVTSPRIPTYNWLYDNHCITSHLLPYVTAFVQYKFIGAFEDDASFEFVHQSEVVLPKNVSTIYKITARVFTSTVNLAVPALTL